LDIVPLVGCDFWVCVVWKSVILQRKIFHSVLKYRDCPFHFFVATKKRNKESARKRCFNPLCRKATADGKRVGFATETQALSLAAVSLPSFTPARARRFRGSARSGAWARGGDGVLWVGLRNLYLQNNKGRVYSKIKLYTN
jgi:hypothetical protein